MEQEFGTELYVPAERVQETLELLTETMNGSREQPRPYTPFAFSAAYLVHRDGTCRQVVIHTRHSLSRTELLITSPDRETDMIIGRMNEQTCLDRDETRQLICDSARDDFTTLTGLDDPRLMH